MGRREEETAMVKAKIKRRKRGPILFTRKSIEDRGCTLRPKCLECDLPECVFDSTSRGHNISNLVGYKE